MTDSQRRAAELVHPDITLSPIEDTVARVAAALDDAYSRGFAAGQAHGIKHGRRLERTERAR